MADQTKGGGVGYLGRAAMVAGATVGAETVAPGAGAAAGGTAAAFLTLTGIIKGLQKTLESITGPIGEIADSGQALAGSMGAKGWFDSMAEAALKVDELRANIQRATGQSDQYAKSAVSLQGALVGLGVSTAEVTETFTALHDGYADFSELNTRVQKEIAKTATSFTRLGIAQTDFAKNANLMTKAMGKTEGQMQKMQKELAKAALALGVAPGKLAKDFSTMMPRLLRFGHGAKKIFYDLAAQSKATGVEMGSLLQVTEGFMMFDEAAEKVARFNTLVGGPLLNTFEMMSLEGGEALELVAERLKQVGFDAESLGKVRGPAIAKNHRCGIFRSFDGDGGGPRTP